MFFNPIPLSVFDIKSSREPKFVLGEKRFAAR